MRTTARTGMETMNHHFSGGFSENVETFMPKKPTVKVKGRKLVLLVWTADGIGG
jgi:hypothetical protein